MADTQRTKATLLASHFQDGQTEGISAQDMRDLIESISSVSGSCYVSTPAETTISTINTYVKAAGTTTFNTGVSHRCDDNSVSNRIRYTGVAEIHAQISANLCLTAATNNQTIKFQIYKYDASEASGALVSSSTVSIRVSTSTDIVHVSMVTDLHLDTNDYIEVWVANASGTANVTVENMNLSVNGNFF